MITGMSTSCFFSRENVEDSIDVMADMGVKNIEVFLNTLCEYEEDYIRELKKRIDARGMKVLSVHPQGVQFELQMYTPYERTVKDAKDIFKKVLRAGELLGATGYVYHGGYKIKPGKSRPPIERIAKITSECANEAKNYGINFLYENVHWCWYCYPDFATEILNCELSDNVYFNLDIKQAAQAGYSYRDFLYKMAGRLKNVHLCDYTLKSNGAVVPVAPFLGVTDLFELKEELNNMGYDGPVILELYSGNYTDYSELSEVFKGVSEVFSDKSSLFK